MSMIRVSDLSFCYEGSYDEIFSHVSFSIDTDWKLGFVGRNGKGKTTFLRLLQGMYPYTGRIDASVAFTYFPFEMPDPARTAQEVALTLCEAPLWQLERELSKLCVDLFALSRPYQTLSMGERTKLLLAALFLRPNNFLLIDEPTNHLDLAGRQTVSRYLNGKQGFLLVSHDRAFLDGCIDHVLSINRCSITVQKGNYACFAEEKQRQDRFELAQNEKLEQQIERLSQSADRTAGWSNALERDKIGTHAGDRGYIGAKSAKLMKRAKSIRSRQEDAVAEKQQLLKNIERNETLKITPLRHHAAILAEAIHLVPYYGEHAVTKPISFTIRQGERIALTGKNGAGKSTLLKFFTGQPPRYDGTFRTASGLVISYVPQDTSYLCGLPIAYARARGIDETLFLTILRKFDFPRVQFEKDMRFFSAGQKKKIALAVSLSQQAHLYVWDEPLNYIDLLSRIQIEELLQKGSPTLLFVEHDAAFLEHMQTDTIPL